MKHCRGDICQLYFGPPNISATDVFGISVGFWNGQIFCWNIVTNSTKENACNSRVGATPNLNSYRAHCPNSFPEQGETIVYPGYMVRAFSTD